jgi:hypothetical protein
MLYRFGIFFLNWELGFVTNFLYDMIYRYISIKNLLDGQELRWGGGGGAGPILHVNERSITGALSTRARIAEHPLIFENCFGVTVFLL